MTVHQRSLAAIATAAGLTAASLALAAPSSAAPYVMAPALSVSTTSPCMGAALTVTGTDFVPGSTVTLTLSPPDPSLGSVVVGAAGGFTTTITVPRVTGTHELEAAGPAAPRNPNAAEATLDIQSCAGPVPITGYTGSGLAGGASSYTLPAGLAAAGFLLLGGGLLAWRRRRRHVT